MQKNKMHTIGRTMTRKQLQTVVGGDECEDWCGDSDNCPYSCQSGCGDDCEERCTFLGEPSGCGAHECCLKDTGACCSS